MSKDRKRLNEIFSRMEEMAKPALFLRTAQSPGFSRLGGRPYLPKGLNWPFWRGRPLNFIAQLDLAEIRAAETCPEMPANGRLYFFYPGEWDDEEWADRAMPSGLDPKDAGSAVVLYSLEEPYGLLEPPAEMKQPGFYIIDDYTATYQVRYLEAKPIESVPYPYFVIGRELGDMTDEDQQNLLSPLYDKYQEYIDSQFGGSLYQKHQLGGHPIPEQWTEAMTMECQLASNGIIPGRPERHQLELLPELISKADDWGLLMQFDTDDFKDLPEGFGGPMVWRGQGLIYFWIRKQDLAARDFNRVWALVQCS